MANVYEEHSASTFCPGYLLTDDADLAEDLVQDAFVRLIGRFADLRRSGSARRVPETILAQDDEEARTFLSTCWGGHRSMLAGRSSSPFHLSELAVHLPRRRAPPALRDVCDINRTVDELENKGCRVHRLDQGEGWGPAHGVHDSRRGRARVTGAPIFGRGQPPSP